MSMDASDFKDVLITRARTLLPDIFSAKSFADSLADPLDFPWLLTADARARLFAPTHILGMELMADATPKQPVLYGTARRLYRRARDRGVIEPKHYEAAFPASYQAALHFKLSRPWLAQRDWFLAETPETRETLRAFVALALEFDARYGWELYRLGLIPETVERLSPKRLAAFLLATAQAGRIDSTAKFVSEQLPLRELFEVMPGATIWQFLTPVFDRIQSYEID